MRHLLILALLPGLGLTGPASATEPRAQKPRTDAPAAARPTSSTVACTASAYVVDRDPNGLNVRRAPDASAQVSTRLRAGDAVAVAVRITGARGAWMRIDRAHTQGGDRVLFAGTGWVYGPLLGVDGVGAGTPLRGCRGDWLHLDYGGVRGWARADAVCANSLTSCS